MALDRRQIRIVPATDALARAMAPRMREADAIEVAASNGHTPLSALLQALDVSSYARALIIGGEVAALFGAAPLSTLGGVGTAWVLTSRAVDHHRKDFLRVSRVGLRLLLERFPVLVNAIDARYAAALRWARWLGFTLGEPAPYGVAGLPFVPIRLEAPHV